MTRRVGNGRDLELARGNDAHSELGLMVHRPRRVVLGVVGALVGWQALARDIAPHRVADRRMGSRARLAAPLLDMGGVRRHLRDGTGICGLKSVCPPAAVAFAAQLRWLPTCETNSGACVFGHECADAPFTTRPRRIPARASSAPTGSAAAPGCLKVTEPPPLRSPPADLSSLKALPAPEIYRDSPLGLGRWLESQLASGTSV